MQRVYLKLKSLLSSWPLFLILLPLFFIYSGYNELFGFLSYDFVLQNLLVILAGVLLLFLSSYALFRQNSKASLFTFLISLIFLTFGYLYDSVKQLAPQSFIIKFTFLLPALLFLFIVAFIGIQKSKKKSNELYVFLNLLFIILLLSETPNSIKRYKIDKSVNNLIDFRFSAYNNYQPKQMIADSSKPDIYFLIFDAMASSKSIQQNFGRDMHQLDSFLLKKGFYVVTNGSANYNWTIHSLSSTLNMDYLPSWIAPVANDPKSYFWGSSSILNNSLFSILKQEGYHINSYQPISFDNEDWPGKSFFSNLRDNHFYFKTLPGRIWRDIFWNYTKINTPFIHKRQMEIIAERNREKKQYFDTTIALVKKSCSFLGKPKFTYGHFMIPHEQYIFDSSGHVKPPMETIIKRREQVADYYLDQVIFARKVIIDLTTYIQENNRKNTIIIVAGDHGYRTDTGNKTGYSFKNFNSIYFPDENYQHLYDSLSPVNTFRIVLNKYFNAGLTLHKDSSIVVTFQKEAIINSKKINPKTHLKPL
jgi:hypothetical protein